MSKKFLANIDLSGTITASGNITAPEVHATNKLVADTVGGDEGGEILLGKAVTNTTLSGTGVTIDVYQNKLRFFEQGGSARGYYIDISGGGAGVGTNLVGGGAASDSFKTISVSGQSDVVADSSTDTLTLVAGSNVTITTNATSDSITFATTGALPTGGTVGQVLSKNSSTNYDTSWVDTSTLNVSTVQHLVKLGESISKGQAVYVSSANGTNMIVSKASNASESTSSKTMGLIDATGVTNDLVNVITEGLLAGLDTSTATVGDPVWLGASGNLIFGSTNKPVAPAHLVFIGIVTRVSATVGEIFIKVQNGFELQEIHNVLIGSGYSSTPSDKDLLTYESSSSLWKNKSFSTLDLATLTSPTFTGTPAAPTAAVDTNTTQIATTAYVVGQGYLKSSSYTASDVLSKLLTVDGTTSGLDADLLDGQHGSYYATTTSVTNKVLYQSTAPTSPSAGDVWVDSSNDIIASTIDQSNMEIMVIMGGY